MRCIILLVIFFLNTAVSDAQLKYQGSIEGGLLNGSWETNGYIQTTHGVQKDSWFIGLGAGIDYYRYRTVPLYLELSKRFGKRNVQPFIIASGGVNCTYPTNSQKQQNNGWMQLTDAEFSNGVHSKAGVGVLFANIKRVQLAINASWNYKTLTRSYTEWNWSIWPQPDNTVQKKMEYHLHRLSIGLCAMF